MILHLVFELGPVRLTIGDVGAAQPAPTSRTIEASGQLTQDISDQLPMGFGSGLATEREHRY